MRLLAINLLLLGLSAMGLRAQTSNPAPVGSVIKGFSLPQRNEAGAMEAMMTGKEARVISANRTEISDLKIELYDNNEVTTVITSPKADYWRTDNRLSTRSTVSISRKDMDITSQSMEWDYKTKQGTLRHQVKVVLHNIDLGTPTQKTTEPAKTPIP